MASYPAPSAILPHFNPKMFETEDIALTLADANKLYFKKSGGIINGAVSMPSLTLNGVSVSNKLNEIDTNSAKLIDVSYNNNTTSILNDLSINGVLKLPNLPNTGTTILDNKQKTTKISYDAGTSVTTIADTLKSSGTLIVGSQNYNASDEFYKLIGISRDATFPILTITDAVNFNGILNLQNHSDLDTIITQFDTILLNMSYTSIGSLLTISSNVKIPQNLQLGTISDVEQKILDINNTTTNLETNVTGISYNSVQDLTTIDNSLNITSNLQIGSIVNVEDAINNAGGVPSITYDAVTETTTFDGSFVYIPTDLSFQLGPLIPNLYTFITSINSRTSWLENTGQGLQINNNTIIEENLGSRSSQLSIRPEVDLQDAVQEIYSKNGTATLKLGDDDGTTITFSNILKSENGNATFYGNNSGETKFMEYNSNDDKINISKDMDLTTNDLTCNFMRPLAGGNYGLSKNWTQSYLLFRNGGHHIDSFNTADDTGRDLYLNFYAESGVIIGSNFNNSQTTINGNLKIIENTGTPASAAAGSLTLIHQDTGGSSSIVFKSKQDGTDYAYISYTDDIDAAGGEKSLLEIGAQNDGGGTGIDSIALMPSGFVGINTQTPEYMLDLNGDMRTYNTIIGERPYLNTDGNGISVKPLTNPSLNGGSIFDVRSIGNGCRLFCGQSVTSSVKNPFCFGYNSTDGQEGLSTNYTGKLGTDGSVECSEVKVNSIPLNSFFNFTFGYDYTPSSNFGKGRHIAVDPSTFNETYSHFVTFDRTQGKFTCKAEYLGTYEIQAHVTYRNTSSSRHNPCIAIGVDDDVVNGVIGSTGTSPKWTTALTNSYSQHNIFSAQYVRMGEGKVTTLSSTRIYHFTNTTDEISINTFVEIAGGNDFDEEAGAYDIINAGISFKYIGNFENIT